MCDNFPWEARQRCLDATQETVDGKSVVDPVDLRAALSASSIYVPEFGASELRVMAYLDYVVEGLGGDEKRRVLAWLMDRHQSTIKDQADG